VEGLEGGGGEAGALAPELKEQWAMGGREKTKSQLEGVWVLFCFFFSSSGNRTMGLCLQQRTYSISS
jgi:hypothetical protein